MKKKFVLPIVFILIFLSFFKMEGEKRTYTTKRAGDFNPLIDGSLNEPVWNSVEWSSNFIQRAPEDGQKPTLETSFKILYDDKNLYVGIRAFDNEPGKIDNRLARRDHFAGDWVEINIDSYFDHLTAFSFTITAAGVKGDEAISNNGDIWDSSWNPVWYAGTRIDEKGWTAEMKIPFSQLRFADKEKHTWGLQVNRRLFRKEELSSWQRIPSDAPGWVHLFGELHGLEGIKNPKQIELVPYLASKYETFARVEGNPFADGNATGFDGGLDGKIGLTSDLIFDFTVKPDFGQVEADPSEVNLTAFETFFSEKRPFFIEGKNILNFQITSRGANFTRDNLFYSRRIGSLPHYQPAVNDNEFIDMPINTDILAAAKLTGKTKNGWSIAVLDSITAKEKALIDSLGQRREETVEPFTNYFVLRMQKDYRNGDSQLGGMFTATNRDINEPNLDFLHRSAYSGGFDLRHSWKNKTYYLIVKTLFSHVTGSREAILETQQSSRRYYQRPDAEHISVDPERTSLTGHGGTISAGKEGNGSFLYSAGVTWRSPGLELNDVGYLRTADRIMQWAWLGYKTLKPFSIFRNLNVTFNQSKGWDFGGTNLFDSGNVNFSLVFKNYWMLSGGINRNFNELSTTELRGGPALICPGSWSQWLSLQTDSRKKMYFMFDVVFSRGNDSAFRSESYSGNIVLRPTNALQLSMGLFIERNKRELQYVDTLSYNLDPRYIFAAIDQKTVALTFRFDITITPDLSIEFYGQPFISAGKYSNFKRIISPRAGRFNDRFQSFSADEISFNPGEELFYFDENGDGKFDYSTAQPDFNFRQFRSNLVIRWEYKPGSIIFLIWSQGRTEGLSTGNFSFRDDFRDLFKVPPHNVFLLKFSYRFNF
ncbi:MAG: carbohydrate binding family 9 domain-containing protein [Acidobacteria bacterium]|jgi:hypothetical protein|nr:carbohydrate binding family 9 domain-containing protein [Acidobacteriota bacterium]